MGQSESICVALFITTVLNRAAQFLVPNAMTSLIDLEVVRGKHSPEKPRTMSKAPLLISFAAGAATALTLKFLLGGKSAKQRKNGKCVDQRRQSRAHLLFLY